MATPLTPQQKLEKKQRDNLKLLHNRILSSFSFKEITTWQDVATHLGQPGMFDGQADKKTQLITYIELKEFLERQKKELEERILYARQGQQPPATQPTDTSPAPSVSQTKTDTATLPTPEIQSQPVYIPPSVSPIPTERPIQTEDNLPTSADRIKLTPSPNEDVFYPWFQKKAIIDIRQKMLGEHKRALLLISGTGSGKTFMSYGFLRRLEDMQFHEGRTFSHIPYLWVTRSTVVEQTERVGKSKYNMGVEQMEVINIEQLRSKSGRLWVTEKMEIVNGEEEWFWTWKKGINPCVIVWDECQALKNDTSTQHKIASAYNDLASRETYQLFVSATPFTRVSEAKCFAVATRRNIEHLGFPPGTLLTNETWPAYAAAIASPSKPDEYNESAVERLMKDLDDYVVRVKGIRLQFDAVNNTEIIQFETKEDKEFYAKAWDRYMEEIRKMEIRALAEGKDPKRAGGIGRLVEFLKFRMAAEFARRRTLARRMYESVSQGKAAAAALNFKSTIIAVTKILVDDYNVPREQISLVWGGGQTQLTSKQKVKQQIEKKRAVFEAQGMSVEEMLEDLDLDNVEDRIIEELDPSLRLGPQSPEERQREIDRFQSGKSLYCMFTFRAGGVGLSLHHSDEAIPQELKRSALSQLRKSSSPTVLSILSDYDKKRMGFARETWNTQGHNITDEGDKLNMVLLLGVRRKESGYAVEEDIRFVPVRPRQVFVAPTYSAIELVQALGRCPRLTSLSVTEQTLLFYEGTIEEDVAAIVAKKLRCLSKVVRMKEKWEDVVTNVSRHSEITRKHIEAVPEEDSGENGGTGLIGEGDEDE